MHAFGFSQDCQIKLELFRSHYRKTKGKSEDPDAFTRIFGSTVPKNIPESAAWWRGAYGARVSCALPPNVSGGGLTL